MVPFAGFLIGGVFFYFIVRGVARDQELNFWWCCAWLAGAAIVGSLAAFVAGPHALGFPDPLPDIAHVIFSVAALTAILWHQGYAPKQVWTIMGLYTGIRIALLLLILLLAYAR